MNFIKRIFSDNINEGVHLQFQKFSKGEFGNRAVIKAKRSGEKYTVFTSAEFANELVREVAQKLGSERTNITGAVVSTNDLTGKLNFKEKKQFQGVKRYLIDGEMSGNEILNLIDNFPKAFFALSFKAGSSELKIKPKAPKTGKPGPKGGDGPKADFCKLITMDKNFGQSFVFEKPDFKEAEINHIFVVNDIIISEELKKSGDFARMREEAKKKGKIIRKAKIDGKEMNSEKEFAV